MMSEETQVMRTGTHKRTAYEKQRDRSLIAQMYFKAGLTHQEITDELNSRENVDYTLSRRMISYDIESVLKEWKENQDNPEFWVTEAIQRTRWVEAAAWRGWERSLEPKEREIIKSGFHGEKDFEEVSKLHENNIGDKGFLKIILDAIRERNRLQGIGAARLHIKQETEHTIKTYAIVSPEDWDRDSAVDGKYEEQNQLTDGN